jgi:ABC-type transport system involved in cytochrome c biogenesis permease component
VDENPRDRRIDEEPLVRIAARRAYRSVKKDATTPEYARLLAYQAFGAAGDTLLALALAGTLFFSVPETTARGRVALYLALTVAPFAVVSPFLARFLDRHRGSLKWAMVASAAGRATLTWLLATRLESLYLFPLAFGILLLSRASLIVRGAVLPGLLPEGQSLVRANAGLSRIGAIAGMAAAVPGILLVRFPGVETELVVGAIVYYLGAVPALLVPVGKGKRTAVDREAAKAAARSLSIRQATVAMAGMRALVGFLVFHLAFALRREDFGSVGLGLLVGSAAFGGLVGAIAAPRLRNALREEGILVASLAGAGVVSFVAGRWFTPVSAGVLVFVFGVAAGAAKVAFDAIVQRETPEAGRGWAFARFESILQLAWVVGALVPLIVEIPASPGVIAVGVGANVVAIVFTFARQRARAAARL